MCAPVFSTKNFVPFLYFHNGQIVCVSSICLIVILIYRKLYVHYLPFLNRTLFSPYKTKKYITRVDLLYQHHPYGSNDYLMNSILVLVVSLCFTGHIIAWHPNFVRSVWQNSPTICPSMQYLRTIQVIYIVTTRSLLILVYSVCFLGGYLPLFVIFGLPKI